MYYDHVCRVSPTSIPCLLSSQASRHFSICRQMAWDAVTCWARCSIQVPQSLPHPPQLFPKHPDKMPAYFPARHVIAPQWHDRKFRPPRLPQRVISDAAIQVGARVGMNPVSVDLPELKVLRSQGVPRIVPLCPSPLCPCRCRAALSSLRCDAGHCSS